MKYLVLLCALLRLGLSQITTDDCMMTLRNFGGSLTSGAALRVCSRMDMQCCTQANEDMLGMSLSRALQSNFTLGSEVYSLRQNAMTLYNQMAFLRQDFITNVIRELLREGVDRGVGEASSLQRFDRVTEDTISNITVALSGELSADSINLTTVLRTFFMDGVSRFYFDLNYGDQNAERTACGVDRLFQAYFSQSEQAKIYMIAENLRQMGDIFQLVRGLVMAASRVQSAVENFTLSQTCTDIWTSQYACPLCAGNSTPLCLGTCNEVLIGCLSPLNQAIVQLNIFRELVIAGVQSVLNGMPLSSVAISSFRDNYASIFTTSSDFMGSLDELVTSPCMIARRKKSVDGVRQKRQSSRINNLPNPMINSTISPEIMNTISTLNAPSLANDRNYLCANLNSTASTCTSTFNSLDVADQATNPAGMFNTTMLRIQAETQPYVVTDFVDMDDGNTALFMSLLPNTTIPDTSFTIVPSATPMASATPTPTSTGGGNGGATAVSFSLLTTLVALMLTYFL